MNREIFVKQLNEIFKRYDFVKKGMRWFFDAGSLLKMIQLQKSRFGNFYYINYGYIIKNLDLDNEEMHVFNGLGSKDNNINARIKELLDIDYSINDKERFQELEKIINDEIFDKFSRVNTEEDIYNELKKRHTLNDISLLVKEYFQIPIE